MISAARKNELPARERMPRVGARPTSARNSRRPGSRLHENSPDARRRKARVAWLYCLSFGLAVFFCCASASAQTPGAAPFPGATPVSPCDKAKDDKSLANVGGCLKHIYDKVTAKEGFHLVHGSVVPGSGTTGGIGYTKKRVSENWRIIFNSSARVSIKKYWEIDSNLRLTKSDNTFSGNTATGPVGDLKINIYGLVKDMTRLDFFGLGPESREQDRAVFHYREGVVGADISKPLKRWLDVGAAFESIWPHLVDIANPTVRSVERVYTEASAPGLSNQPNFLHPVAFVGLHSPGQPESRKLDYKFFYHLYYDWQDGRFTFRRFDADLKHKFPFAKKNEIRVRGRFSFAETTRGRNVPFYLQETLGGSNIRGDDTLRGFRDYRFRDRDLALLQTEYLRRIYGPVDFIAFYDTGKVAPSLSRFGEGRLRHTYGLGIVVVPRQGDNVWFRFYVALGSGEGSHTYISLGDALGGRADRLVR
jgi:hypothetical protein